MFRFSCCFWVLLSFFCLLAICMNTDSDLCKSLKTVRDDMNATQRRRYMKMNFPINYTIQVHYEEVFRVRNISRLMNMSTDGEQVEEIDLQYLWLDVSQEGIKRILRVLPERHPTRTKYLSKLETLFKKFEEVFIQHFNKYLSQNHRQIPECIENIQQRIKDPYYQGWKSIKPKSILDNCYRTMPCLFRDCFPNQNNTYDYCIDLNWSKEKKTT